MLVLQGARTWRLSSHVPRLVIASVSASPLQLLLPDTDVQVVCRGISGHLNGVSAALCDVQGGVYEQSRASAIFEVVKSVGATALWTLLCSYKVVIFAVEGTA